MISVVIPAFNEQENIPAAAERLGGILAVSYTHLSQVIRISGNGKPYTCQ